MKKDIEQMLNETKEKLIERYSKLDPILKYLDKKGKKYYVSEAPTGAANIIFANDAYIISLYGDKAIFVEVYKGEVVYIELTGLKDLDYVL